MLTIEVEGYAEAKRIMDELPNTMQKRMLLVALRASAKPMLQSARSKVPVRTGKLKKQLRTVRYKDRNASKSEVAIAVKPVFGRTKKKGAVNEYYGKFIHEGTADPRTSKRANCWSSTMRRAKGLCPQRRGHPADALFGAGLYGELRAYGGDLRRRVGRGGREVRE